jgi:hypothetical protein
MPVSEAQLAANRANALKSTGPRTPEGKNISRLNGTRHRVTQQVMIMPEPQMQAYLDFHKEQQEAHKPADPIEKQLVQTVIDTQWRMNCARAWEMSLFADNHEKYADLLETERPDVQAAMTAPLTLSKKANELRLLSLYEQRLNRTLQSTMKMLNERQAERKKREEQEMEEANQIAKLFKMKGEVYNPADDGFGFSPKKFVMYQSREEHREEARIAYRVGYNLKKFQAELANSANA